jgi:hypothetical protein
MKPEQFDRIEELVKLVKHLPFWTEMFEPPRGSDFRPTGYIMLWWDGGPVMVDHIRYRAIMHGSIKPECWCRIVPPRQRTKNGK